MNLHEYQAKQLLGRFGVPVLSSFLAYTPQEARKACVDLGGGTVVIKAQIHAGGRGKAGGVKVARNPLEAKEKAESILGKRLFTPQTGPEGKLVTKVLVESGTSILREYYLSLVVDRDRSAISFIVSSEGGVEIEEVALATPEKVLTVTIPFATGFQATHARRICFFLGVTDKEQQQNLSKLLSDTFQAFKQLDCSLLEINPLAQVQGGEFICLDCKMSIDDNALYRQPEARRFLDYDEVDEREIRAGELGLSYIALQGNIGCMVNGAGLAMATMDIIKTEGGEPANFLDVGGGATQEKVTEAFKLILQDERVKAVLVNIFGGIMRCDVIAEGVVQAVKNLDLKVPLVVRLEGTNVDLGKQILVDSGLTIIPAEGLADAAKKIVKVLGEKS